VVALYLTLVSGGSGRSILNGGWVMKVNREGLYDEVTAELTEAVFSVLYHDKEDFGSLDDFDVRVDMPHEGDTGGIRIRLAGRRFQLQLVEEI